MPSESEKEGGERESKDEGETESKDEGEDEGEQLEPVRVVVARRAALDEGERESGVFSLALVVVVVLAVPPSSLAR